jgi:hypothetical protein
MPLVSGSSPGAFKQNVRTLMGEVGKSPHVQSRQQALAIAYSKQRAGRADGGSVYYGLQRGGPVLHDPTSILGALQRGTYDAARRHFQTGGVVRHDNDPDLPGVQDDASLHDMLDYQTQPQREPAYIQTMRRLLEGQKRLNAMHPVQREMLRRYWLGGMVHWLGSQ